MSEHLQTEPLVVPDFTVESKVADSLPPVVNDFFEMRSRMYVLPENAKGVAGFDFMCTIDCAQDSILRYVGSERKIYDTDGTDETLVNIIEVTVGSNKVLGHGEIRLGHSEEPFFKDKPFVGFTRTNPEFLRQGLGMRRVFAMNHLTRLLFDLPLNSSTLLSEDAARLWQRLCTDNLAESYLEGDRKRYAFSLP
jgi:hypothetical protein